MTIDPKQLKLEESLNLDKLELKQINPLHEETSVEFKRKIDNLNLKFYAETDKFIHLKEEIEKSQDNLFLLLFKQVAAYREEIDRMYAKSRNNTVKR